MMSAARMNLSVLRDELDDPGEIATFEKAMHLVDESCKEVRQVSHNIMPNTLMKRGLVYAVNEFINSIDKKAMDINVYTDNMDVRLPVNVEIMLYRAIQECVNNVIKHAQAKRVNISIIKDEDEISITIEDNGKGFDVKAGAGDKGIGLKNIETRIQYLKGTVSWESSPGNGTVVIIYVPAGSYALLSKQELVMN
jgi:signal transduction histidine kinase